LILVLKAIACLVLLVIIYQDLKERLVFWFLFPLLGILLFYLLYSHSIDLKILGYYIGLNLILITTIIAVIFVITKVVFKKPFLNHSFGLGDLLFFYAFALGFPTMTFIILFANSLIFSFLLYLAFKKSRNLKTIPLAGFMSIFLFLILGISIFAEKPSLYNF
jgi:hypothetical protein